MRLLIEIDYKTSEKSFSKILKQMREFRPKVVKVPVYNDGYRFENLKYIRKTVCNYFNINYISINEKTRKREIVQARQIIHFFGVKLTGLSSCKIASEIGGKDHATCLHSVKTVSNLIETDRIFRKYIIDIQEQLGVKINIVKDERNS